MQAWYVNSSIAVGIKYEINVHRVKLSISSATTGCI